jgi:hypothetical protein|tara:strand:+ start:820 stop:1020 length:201 start_codon:yes stop_codon:yes gene_type:complete
MILPNDTEARHIVWELHHEMHNTRNCGFTGLDMKKRLWGIKNAVDAALATAPKYHGEPEFKEIEVK